MTGPNNLSADSIRAHRLNLIRNRPQPSINWPGHMRPGQPDEFMQPPITDAQIHAYQNDAPAAVARIAKRKDDRGPFWYSQPADLEQLAGPDEQRPLSALQTAACMALLLIIVGIITGLLVVIWGLQGPAILHWLNALVGPRLG